MLEVIGYHGTSVSRAAIIQAEGFKFSANEYDWLGDGVYFFQDAPRRAWEWARKVLDEQPDEQPAVVGARIQLRSCIDLLDIGWFRFLSEAYDGFLAKSKRANLPLPRQTGGAHRLDREVLNYAIGILAESGQRIGAVRGAFAEGAPAFPNSALRDRSHIQIAVRDMSLILNSWIESEQTP